MDQTAGKVSATFGVAMLDPEIVVQTRALRLLGWGKKRIAKEVGCAKNSVARYLDSGIDAEIQTRPGAWTLDAEQQALARTLLDGAAAGNAVVVQQMLAEKDDYDRRNGLGFSARRRPTTEHMGGSVLVAFRGQFLMAFDTR